MSKYFNLSINATQFYVSHTTGAYKWSKICTMLFWALANNPGADLRDWFPNLSIVWIRIHWLECVVVVVLLIEAIITEVHRNALTSTITRVRAEVLEVKLQLTLHRQGRLNPITGADAKQFHQNGWVWVPNIHLTNAGKISRNISHAKFNPLDIWRQLALTNQCLS